MTGKEFLQRIHYQKSRVQHLEERLGEFNSKLYSPKSSSMSATPSGKNRGDRYGDLLSKKDELQLQYIKALDELIDIRLAVWKAIDALENPLWREIMFLRYDSFMSWEEIERETGKSRGWIYEIHALALREIEKGLNDEIF